MFFVVSPLPPRLCMHPLYCDTVTCSAYSRVSVPVSLSLSCHCHSVRQSHESFIFSIKCGRNTKHAAPKLHTPHTQHTDRVQTSHKIQHMAHVPLQSFGVDFSSVKTVEEARVVTLNTRTGTLQEQKHLTYVAHQLRCNCVLAVRAYNACQASTLARTPLLIFTDSVKRKWAVVRSVIFRRTGSLKTPNELL